MIVRRGVNLPEQPECDIALDEEMAQAIGRVINQLKKHRELFGGVLAPDEAQVWLYFGGTP